MGLREALAAVLSSDAVRRSARADPSELPARFSLDPAEVAVLQALPPSRLDLVASNVQARRWGLLTALPVLACALAEFEGGRLRAAYLSETASPSGTVGLEGWLTRDPRQLVQWLSARHDVPRAFVELAGYELLRLELAEDAQAARAAASPARRNEAEAAPPTIGITSKPSVSPAVRIAEYDIDVLTVGHQGAVQDLISMSRVPTIVLLQKFWGERTPRVYRIDRMLASMLRQCDGQRSLHDIRDRSSIVDERFDAGIISLIQRGVLSLTEAA